MPETKLNSVKSVEVRLLGLIKKALRDLKTINSDNDGLAPRNGFNSYTLALLFNARRVVTISRA